MITAILLPVDPPVDDAGGGGAGQQSVPQQTSAPCLHPHTTCFGRVPFWNCN